MKLSDLESFLNVTLKPEEFKDHCPNGLLVVGSEEVKKGIVGVSLNLELIEYAVSQQVDFIFVHHPHDFWNNQSRVLRGRLKTKTKLLLENDISVFAYHLPLDSHPEFGNNSQLIKALGLEVFDHFAFEGKHPIGYLGKWSEAKDFEEVLALIDLKIGKPNFVLKYGKDKISTVGICSGSYPQGVEELIARQDVDLYITGEIREQTTYIIQEEKFNFIAAGHHQTERFGPRAIGDLLKEKFKLEIEFYDSYNPV